MVVYSLLSHTLDFLPWQLVAMRKFLPAHRVVVVQGPYGQFAGTSGGNVRLRQCDADRLGVSILEVACPVLGLSCATRPLMICDWLWEEIVPDQAEQYAMIVHGDLFPTQPMTISDMLEDKSVACRLQYHGGKPYCPLTWYLTDKDAGPTAHPSTLADNLQVIQGWPARRAAVQDIPGGGFDPDLWWEVCGPGWLHVDKQSLASAVPDFHARKMKLLRSVMAALGIDAPDVGQIGETLTGLAVHLPRAMGIPDSMMPEKAMGCAGCGR